MSALVLIPARGGSKGLPGKNLREVGGISLVGRAVRAGRRFLTRAGVDGVVLVDSDAEAIVAEGRRWGAEGRLRPAALAADATPMIDTVLAAVEHAGAGVDAVVLLQPTSPLRTAEDVAACWAAYQPGAHPSVLSVTAADHPPEQTLRRDADGSVAWAWPEAAPDARRQDQPAGFRPSGAVYVDAVALLRKERRFLIPGVTRGVVIDGARSIDVDTASDLVLAERMVRNESTAAISIGVRPIGPDAPCYVIAEAGVNHNGDVALAHKLVDLAADAGADAVKFQTFDPDRLVSKAAAMAAYQIANTGRGGSQADLLRGLVLSREAHAALQRHAGERGITFLSTPFDEASADFLETLGVPAFKVGSGELTNLPFLAHLAGKGRPMLISTGMADLVEVAAAVDAIEAAGDPMLGLFHCVTSYPAAPADANLSAMGTMRAAFGKTVGWSDHTEGVAVALAAVAQGATMLEKHITLDRALPGPDHKASLAPDELHALVRGVRAVEDARGDGTKAPRPVELPLIVAARRSLHAAKDLAAGHVLAAGDLVALRPGDGVSPARLDAVLGRRLGRALAAGAKLAEGDLG
jgi:N-acetylneuraminate synthase/N,N'-diacetyllegionaminate synthase